MCCLQVFLFLCILCTKYLLGDLSADTLNVLTGTFIKSFDEQYEIDRTHNALKRQAVVNLPKYGLMQGSIEFTAWTNQTILQFLNVPYAESPSGSRRFKAPVPIKPWNGVRNAENYGIKCPTLNDISKLSQSERDRKDLEDCLNMAIYTTELNASRPVMVYIHGGGFYQHNADEYPPNYLMESEIVLIVIQYRLDILGFLSTSSKEIPGNAGLMDVIQALKFIKENVEYFGGDPNRVTIFGQSSGAAMVSALVISPTVPETLFQQAIIQSGSIFGNWAYSSDPTGDARNIAQAAGLNPNQSISSLNRAFMSMSVYDLLKAVDKYQMSGLMSGKILPGGRSIAIGGPNNLLPDTPEKIIESQNYNKSIPVIIGTTRDDGSYVATVIYDVLMATNKTQDRNFIKNELISAVCRTSGVDSAFESLASLTYWTPKQLSSSSFADYAPGIIDMLGVIFFKSEVFKFGQIHSRINPHRTFIYTFDYEGQHTRFGYGADTTHYPFEGGVHHSDDLIYLFPYPSDIASLDEKDIEMAQKFVNLWTSFATNGVPELPKKENGINALEWQPLSGLTGAYLHIDKNLTLGTDYREEFTVQTRLHRIPNLDNYR